MLHSDWQLICQELVVLFLAPLRQGALTLPELRTTSRMYPAAIRRSRWSSGMVRCIDLLPTSFKEANSSLVSGVSRKGTDANRRLLGMRYSVSRWGSYAGRPATALHRS